MTSDKKNILYIISGIDKALEFEWLADALKNKYHLSYILIGKENCHFESFLKERSISVYSIKYYSKKDFIRAWIQVFFKIKKFKPDIVHTHLFEANLIGLSCAKLAGVKNRVYTRHHSTLHHSYFPKAVKYDLWCNRWATNIIAISPMVKKLLIDKENVNESKIIYIPHGLNFSDFENISGTIELKNKYNPENKKPVIGIISRYTEWKGIQYIIPAFEKLLYQYPDALLILANAKGDFEIPIQAQLSKLPSKNYVTISFEPNIAALYKLFDIFIHAPVDQYCEAFGQIYLEAMASKTPMICTVSGIAANLVVDNENALIVPHKDNEAIFEKILYLLNNPDVANKIKMNAYQNVQTYSIENKVQLHDLLYSKLLQ